MPKKIKLREKTGELIAKVEAKTLKRALLVAVLFTLFSVATFFLQLYKFKYQVVGRVISLQESSVIIESKGGEQTRLLIGPETEIIDGRRGSAQLEEGALVYSYGKRIDEGTFETQSLRVMHSGVRAR